MITIYATSEACQRPNRPGTAAIELALPLRYTGTRLDTGTRLGQGLSRPKASLPGLETAPGGTIATGRSQPDDRNRTIATLADQGLPMPSTFDTVVNIIAETCDIPREN